MRSFSWLLLPLALLATACPVEENPLCGNGLLDDPSEQCDDGNRLSGDGCRADCEKIERCGDGDIDEGEACDDGNADLGDSCRPDCTAERCGDGIIDLGESCDDGNVASGDGCDASCLSEGEQCGNGVFQQNLGEECDDGNLVPGDGCDPICQIPPVEDSFLFTQVDTTFDLAQYCEQMTRRHATVHAVDMQDGGLRWRCGDVTALTPDKYGQEYCEYTALQNGQPIGNAAVLGDEESFQCLFTSVFNDTPNIDGVLLQALAAPENLGATTLASVVRMQRSVNSRNAATGLIGSCSNLAGSTNEVRQVACLQASIAAAQAGDTARADELRSICNGQDLSNDTRFAQAQALGAAVLTETEPGYETQREIRGCVANPRSGGAFFRNSDSTICGRTFRGGVECGCSWNNVPQDLDGFLFTEWLTPQNNIFPPECRFAKVNGQDYPHVMICDVPSQEVVQIKAHPFYQSDLKGFCNDRFGKNLGIFAPLSALEVAGSCQPDGSLFCDDMSAP